MKSKYKGPYLFRFLDHCGGSDEPMETYVTGWILSETKKHYLITTWLVVDDDDETIRANSDKVCIVKSTLIKKPKKLK